MIDGIKYEKINGATHEMKLFDDTDLETWLNEFTHRVGDAGKTIHENFIPLESHVESRFARDCETSENNEKT